MLLGPGHLLIWKQGPSSNIAFTRHIVSATTAVLKRTHQESIPNRPDDGLLHSHVLHMSRPPSPFEIRRGRAERVDRNSVNPFHVPPTAQALELLEQYFANTGLLFPYIHRESFLNAYHELHNNNFREVRRSWLGLFNMIMAMSIKTSLHIDISSQQRRTSPDLYFHRAMALCEKQIRTGTSLEIGKQTPCSEALTMSLLKHGGAGSAVFAAHEPVFARN